MTPSPAEVQLFTDGACSGNPGPGGWAFVLRHLESGKDVERSGGEQDSTNNRMELMAVIQGLALLKWPCCVELLTDSVYVGKGLTQWIAAMRPGTFMRMGPAAGLPMYKKVKLQIDKDDTVLEILKRYARGIGHGVRLRRAGYPVSEERQAAATQVVGVGKFLAQRKAQNIFAARMTDDGQRP